MAIRLAHHQAGRTQKCIKHKIKSVNLSKLGYRTFHITRYGSSQPAKSLQQGNEDIHLPLPMAHTSTIAHGPYIHHCPWPMAHLQAGRTQPGFKPVNKKYRFVKTRLFLTRPLSKTCVGLFLASEVQNLL